MEREEMKTVNIKGKNYVEVNQRILYFRANYPKGKILTSIESMENGVCVIRAEIYDDDQLVATGHAYEKEGSTFINKTSYLENCETSAVGRALGILGIGIDTSIASREEVENAILQQDEFKRAKKELPNKLLLEANNNENLSRATLTKTLAHFDIKNWKELDLSTVPERAFIAKFVELLKEVE
jgi:hypothetical protein